MKPKRRKIKLTDWRGLYNEGWKGEITEEAFQHPAKFARKLIQRMYRHALEEGWLAPGDVVIDPFGGVALGGLDAGIHGLQWVGCELEPKFYAIASNNIALWERRFGGHGKFVRPVILNGDSRTLRANLATLVEDCNLATSSPPYNLPMSQDHNGKRGGKRGTNPSETGAFVKYGNTPGQLEGLPMGDLAAALSSPPFVTARQDTTPSVKGESAPTKHDPEGMALAAISSPPYVDSMESGKSGIDWEKAGRKDRTRPSEHRHSVMSNNAPTAYGQTAGQLGAMREGQFDAAMSSPPYEGSAESGSRHGDAGIVGRDKAAGKRVSNFRYSDDPNSNNVGGKTGEDFWSAAKIIVAETFLALRPGGHALWVVKDFVRDKQIVPFCDQWQQLCESVGFVTCCRHRAWLVEEDHHADMFTGVDVRKTERKSFFRRLAEKKGSPRIDYEQVICMVKP